MKSEILTNVEPRKIGFSMDAEYPYSSSSQIIAYGDNIDELVDSVISFCNLYFITEFTYHFIKLLSKENFKKIEESIIAFSDSSARICHRLINLASKIKENSNVKDYDFSVIEKYILDSKDLYAIADFSPYASKIFLAKVQMLIRNSKNAKVIYQFTKNILNLEEDVGDVIDIYQLHEGILETGNKFWIVEYEVRLLKRKPTFWENFWHDGFRDYPKF